MNNYKTSLQIWAKFALNQTFQDRQAWKKHVETLSQVELAELLAVLAGYFSATTKGKQMIESWL